MSERSMPHRDEPLFAILEAVADRQGVDVLELPPLGHVVDTDALTTVLADASGPVTVSFRYEGSEITVDDRGRVQVDDVAASPVSDEAGRRRA